MTWQLHSPVLAGAQAECPSRNSAGLCRATEKLTQPIGLINPNESPHDNLKIAAAQIRTIHIHSMASLAKSLVDGVFEICLPPSAIGQ